MAFDHFKGQSSAGGTLPICESFEFARELYKKTSWGAIIWKISG